MTTDRRLLSGALGLALLVAACGGSAATTPSTSSAASSAPGASVASQAPAASQAPGTSATIPDISLAPGNAADLEAMIPSTVGTLTLQKTSFDGASIPLSGTPFNNSQLDPLLAKYHKSLADLRFAMGVAASGTGMTIVYALQLRGVPATEFMTGLDTGTSTSDQLSLSGKTVYGTTGAGMSSIIYPKDDVVFMVVASDKDAAAIVAALP